MMLISILVTQDNHCKPYIHTYNPWKYFHALMLLNAMVSTSMEHMMTVANNFLL